MCELSNKTQDDMLHLQITAVYCFKNAYCFI